MRGLCGRKGNPRLLGAVLLGALSLLPVQASAQDPRDAGAPPVGEQEVVDRLMELQEEIERLLPFLSPELRRRIAAELARRAAAQQKQAERAAREAPEPAGEEAKAEAGAETDAAAEETPQQVAAGPTEPSRVRSPAARTACNTLEPFDTREDGRIDSGDRYWRYLYLWTDGNGDGEVTEREVRSVFEAGVRNISVRLDRFEGKEGSVGLLRIDRWIVLDPLGDGFSGGITGHTDDGALTVDAGALGRFSGPQLLGPDGRPLEGMQPFRPGFSLREASGRVIELSCPR